MSRPEDRILMGLRPDEPEFIGRHLDDLRRWAADNPEEAGRVINALVGGMVQASARAFVAGLSSSPPRPGSTPVQAISAPVTTGEYPAVRAPFTQSAGSHSGQSAPPEAVMPPAAGLAAAPPPGTLPSGFEVGDRVEHRWLGEGIVERIWWRDDHWHIATDRFGAPASRLKRKH
ncbi:MAG: hypothetical protein R3F60_07820 [bacterium]